MNAEEQSRERFLVLRCQGGDEQAFILLFEQYHGPLKYYLRRLLDSPEQADDIVQTVWLKVLRHIRGLRHPEAFRVWLYRTARNEAWQQLRRDQRWTKIADQLPPPQEDTNTPLPTDDAEKLHCALHKITPPHREVIMLRFFEDLSYDEIAAITQCELGTVRSRLHYAKLALRRLLED